MQAALHQKLAFGLARKLDRFRRGGFAMGDVDQLESADVQSMLPGDRADLGGRSDEYRKMIPASAASVTPRSEVSSQGCATTVRAAIPLARAIRRSYFDPGG